jgi:cytochrome c oxidase subunit 4
MAREHEAAAGGTTIPEILIVGALLIALAFGTFFTSGLKLGAWALPVAILFALAKAALIVLFFMELKHHRGGSRFALAVSVFFVLLLVLFVFGDVTDRFRLAQPPGPYATPEGAGSPVNRFEAPTNTSGPRRTRP